MSVKNIFVRGGLLILLGGVGFYQYQQKHKPLAPQLVSLDDDTRNMALVKLPKLSAKLKSETVLALTTYQSDPNPQARRFALYSLRQLGEPTAEVLAFGVKALTDPDEGVRTEAMSALSRFAEAPLPNLIEVLRTQEGPAVEASIKVLEKLEARAVPALISFIKENPAKGQLAAVRALKNMGKSAKDATPLLLGLLDSKDIQMRLVSAEALAGLGVLNKTAAVNLERDLLLAKESFSDPLAPRPQFAVLLEKIDPRRRELVDLGFDLKQKNPATRYRAAYLISEMNPPSIGTMEILVDALNDSDVFVSARAVAALTRMGLDKTERLKKRATPRLLTATSRAQAAHIEGFDPIAAVVLKHVGQ